MKFIAFIIIQVFLISPAFISSVNAADIRVLKIGKERVAVYRQPSFDSKVLVYLGLGKKLYGTKKKIIGIGGLGFFHRVRLKKDVYGYILDTDVVGFRSSKKNSKLSQEKKSKKLRRKKSKNNKKNNKNKNSDFKGKGLPVSRIKAWGLSGGMLLGYGLNVAGKERKSNEWLAGLKFSGPWLFKKLPLDINLMMHFGAPSFFDSVSTKSSGYFILTDVSVPFVLKHAKVWDFYVKLGALGTYSSFESTINGKSESSSTTRFGAVGSAGVGFRAKNWLIKLEHKYYWEKTQYIDVQLSLQKAIF